MLQRYTPVTLSSRTNTIEIKFINNGINGSDISTYSGLNILWPNDESSIRFINLPNPCWINVYTLSGKLRVTLSVKNEQVIDLWEVLKDMNKLPANAVFLFQIKSKRNEMRGKIVVL